MLTERLFAKGHYNITAKHETTLEFTKDEHISKRATCIIGVGASRSLLEFSDKFKQAIRRDGALVKITVKAGSLVEVLEGFGSSKLTLTHPTDIVCRKSLYTCNRTIMIGCNKAAVDLSPEFKKLLKDPNTVLEIVIEVI
ncbi:MAG: DUF371 domain-containing protein [Candidatus Odinarchaeum yellowstonii]|uniref:DUF371 domain-containing protein n=1 Tax=Odinarchaeota yellowstonii (strain LCB_4) TaxID=1841599 RepID=A0AAF0D348_ODILC|nr:MAG: DUF371 domain-containing protein [Candidatus Odinarchaeum yellowstonii]